MAEARAQAVRAALDAIPDAPQEMTAEDCIVATLERHGFHVVPGAELGVLEWNAGKPNRCPACHAVTVNMERPKRWRVYECCTCAARFTRWPRLAWLLPFAGTRCSEHGEACGE